VHEDEARIGRIEVLLCICRRYWPDEEDPWSQGIITDYRDWSDEHCIVYKINTPSESYEWFRLK